MSRRDEIVNYIVDKVKATEKDVDGYTQSYRQVTRDPIDIELCQKLAPGEASVGVYDISEDKVRGFGFTNSTLTIVVEFYFRPKVGQTKASELNRILAELTKRVMSDYTQGGLALNTEEASNDLDIDGIYDKIINGSITFEVMYRHGTFDPTKALC